MPRVDFSTIERPGKWLEASEIIDLYSQDKYWVDVHRERHLLTKMSHSYLMNVLKLLIRSARGHLSAAIVVADEPKLAWMWNEPWKTPLVKAVIEEIRQRERAQQLNSSPLNYKHRIALHD